MRKTVEVAGLGLLAFLYYLTWSAISGPNPLPDRIPIHFDISGKPNAWGFAQTLVILPIFATGLFVLMTVLASIKTERYNLPVPVTAANLPFIRERTGVMVSWLKLELVCLFTYLQ